MRRCDIVVDVCCHGLALDEGLATLPLTRPSASPANDDADAHGRLFEVWFRGAHSDIGGGKGNTGLSTITLTRMLVRAIHHRLPIPEDVVDGYRRLRRPGTAVKHSSLDTGVRARTVQWHHLVHESVDVEPGGHNPLRNITRANDFMHVVGKFPPSQHPGEGR